MFLGFSSTTQALAAPAGAGGYTLAPIGGEMTLMKHAAGRDLTSHSWGASVSSRLIPVLVLHQACPELTQAR